MVRTKVQEEVSGGAYQFGCQPKESVNKEGWSRFSCGKVHYVVGVCDTVSSRTGLCRALGLVLQVAVMVTAMT